MENLNSKKRLSWLTYKVVIILVIAFVLGFLVRGLVTSTQPTTEHHQSGDSAQDKEQIWTCSMHPNIRQPKPGKCPICLMDLVPVDSGGEVGAREIAFSKDALKLMEIQTSPVERKFVEAQIRMVGKVDYDETRLRYITAWIPGRLDRLHVDYTGVPVSKGDHLVELYNFAYEQAVKTGKVDELKEIDAKLNGC